MKIWPLAVLAIAAAAVQSPTRAAPSGNVDAARQLGERLLQGRRNPDAQARGKAMLAALAENGDGEAAADLADYLRVQIGSDSASVRIWQDAYRYARIAVHHGTARGLYELAEVELTFFPGTPDNDEANGCYWLKRAAAVTGDVYGARSEYGSRCQFAGNRDAPDEPAYSTLDAR